MTDARLRAKVALAELDALGISIADLLAVAATTKASSPAPTFAEYVPVVGERYKARSLRTMRRSGARQKRERVLDALLEHLVGELQVSQRA